MAANTFGEIFRLTTFGESHGPAIGGVIDGCPAGIEIDAAFIQLMLDRRKPGQSDITSPRKESDQVEILSGILDGKSTGTPIGFIIRNRDTKPEDYSHLGDSFRPSHADFTYESKYGVRDHRGGGRSSARETVCRVAGGSIALMALEKYGISVEAWVSSVGTISIPDDAVLDLANRYGNDLRCPHPETAACMHEYIRQIRDRGDSTGGIISCRIHGVPAGLGEPVFDKLHAVLGKAMLSINAVKGFEIGSGFAGSAMTGSMHNDPFILEENRISTKTNYSGGIQGGISNGSDIYFRTAFKPVATIMQDQKTVNRQGEEIVLKGKGRHDPCVVPRAVPIVESMAAMVIFDFLLRNRLSKF